MHVRQVALVARDLEPVVADLCAVLGLEVGFRDPGVAAFGLHNAVMPVGTQFLEVVSPVRDGTTAGRYLDRRGGDGGYMVILQTTDLDADRRRLAALGVRIVWQITLDDIATVHLHPRDVGAAIVSLDEPRPASSWRWGGPGWEAHARTGVVRGFTSVTLAAPDPARLAARWAEVLGLPPPAGCEIALAPGTLRGVAGGSPALAPGTLRFVAGEEGVAAVGLAANDAPRALATARARGLATDAESVTIGGVRFELA
jgi:Glyoxalase-like domain